MTINEVFLGFVALNYGDRVAEEARRVDCDYRKRGLEVNSFSVLHEARQRLLQPVLAGEREISEIELR